MASIVVILAVSAYKHVDKKRKAKKAAQTEQEALIHFSQEGQSSNVVPPPPYQTQPPQYTALHTRTASMTPLHPQASNIDFDTESLAPAPLNIVRRASFESLEARLHYASGSIYEESGDEVVANQSSRHGVREGDRRLGHEIEVEAPPIPPKSRSRRGVVL